MAHVLESANGIRGVEDNLSSGLPAGGDKATIHWDAELASVDPPRPEASGRRVDRRLQDGANLTLPILECDPGGGLSSHVTITVKRGDESSKYHVCSV